MLSRTAVMLVLMQCPAQAQFSLVTAPPDNGGLQGWGVAFNLTTDEVGIRIEGLRTYFTASAGTPVAVSIYTIKGGYQGKTTGTVGWTLVGQATGISAGPNTLSSPLDVAAFAISEEATTGVYLVATLGPLRYQGSSAGATTQFESEYLSLTGGEAKSVPFTISGQTFLPRVFSGEIYYSRVPPAPCYPDCDASGALDVFDLICFGSAHSLANPYADCNADGAFDIFDMLCFQNWFAAGCD